MGRESGVKVVVGMRKGGWMDGWDGAGNEH